MAAEDVWDGGVLRRRRPSSRGPESAPPADGDGGSAGGSSTPPTDGFFGFFWSELSRGYALHNDRARFTEKRRKVYTFMRVPWELERFMSHGLMQCADAFLYVFTFLPLRFVLALAHLILYPLLRRQLAPSEICDLLKVVMVVVCCVMMQYIDTSVVYHLVRGQAIIKLYIFYNMLEVADKLFASFGQDILDALFWTATEPRSVRHTLPHLGTVTHLALAVAYVFVHALLVLAQATTLNVAFNSHNKALLTIMLSNNFVELKGSVFKKFARSNLFQMACSDVRERFHYAVLLSIVVVRNMTAVNWKADHFFEMLPDLCCVVVAEFVVDWLKHAFITKFNEIPAGVYKDFTLTIAYDVVRSREQMAFSDHSDQVSRRMGFTPLPLAVLVIRVARQTVQQPSAALALLAGAAYVLLTVLKVFNSMVLVRRAGATVASYESMRARDELMARVRQSKSKSVPSSPRASLIDFPDVMQQQPNAHQPSVTWSELLRAKYELETVEASAATPLGRSRSVAQLRDVDVPADDDAPAADADAAELSPRRRARASECESLQAVDRYTLLNDDRIEP